ncbi:MAG: hypothetical protein N2109_12290 [Fimbriimonadales bacterium]|nr:hypothetical protein [Fimbriimonadales bacterium]
MDEIRARDRRLFLLELVHPQRLLGLALVWALCWGAFRYLPEVFGWLLPLGAAVAALGLHAIRSYNASVAKRFENKRFQALWAGCADRLERFRKVLKKMRHEQVASLREMPKTVEAVGRSLYAALRRADLVSHEIFSSERGVYTQPPAWTATPSDPQAKELYRIADRNIAEYRKLYDAVMAGVSRTEAQAAVFMTTLDALRVKMLGYRLVDRSPEVPSQDFLEALGEARLQLDAIDKALEELDFSRLPKLIAVESGSAPSQEQTTEPEQELRRLHE